MNRFDKMTLGAAILATLLFRPGTMNAYYFHVDMLHLSGTMVTILVAGWVIATYGPIAIAAWFWRLTKRVRSPWVLHILFLPCAVVMFRTGESLMLFASGETDFEHTLGGPVITAALLFAVAVGGYFAALAGRKFRVRAIEPRSADHP